MKNILTVATALVTGLFFSSSAIAEDAKPAEWLFVHTAETAEMTSATTLVMPVTRDIFAFTDRPNRQHGYMKAHHFVTLWDEGEGDTFKADPPNAVLTWVDGGEMKEAEVLITDAKVVGDGYGVLPSCFRLKHRLVDNDGYTDFNASLEGFSLPS